VASTDESKALNTLEGSAVIISSSGMCEAGRILHHLKNHATDPRSIVLFVGYQAMHTLGRRILERSTNVKIYGEKVTIAGEVRRINGLSAHADRNGLLRYARALDKVPDGIFLVHGDTDRIAALQSWFHEHGLPGATGPAAGDWKRLL
jgi:metallo-beta-lactamase family protein